MEAERFRTFVKGDRVYVAPETVQWPLGLAGHVDLALTADGHYVVVGLHLTTTTDDPITSTDLRSITLGETVKTATSMYVIPCTPVQTFDGGIAWQPDGGQYVDTELEMNSLRRKPGRPAKYGPDHLLNVWQIIQQAEASGGKVIHTVATRFGVEKSTAKNWVPAARKQYDPNYTPRNTTRRKP